MRLYLTISFILVLTFSYAQDVEETVSERVEVEMPEVVIDKDSLKQEVIAEGEETIGLVKENFLNTKEEFRKSYNQALQPVNDSLPKLSLIRNKERLRKRYPLDDSLAVNKKLETISFSHPDEVTEMVKKEMNSVYDAEREGTFSDLKSFDTFSLDNFKMPEINGQKPLFQKPEIATDKIINTGDIKIDTKIVKVEEVQRKVKDIDPAKALDQLKGEALSAKRVYSEKALKKIYDSLGLHNVDSIAEVATTMAKKDVTEQELLESIRQSFPEYQNENDLDTAKLAALQQGDLNVLEDELGRDDLSELKLPDSVMSELPPTRLSDIDSKYLDAIDSVRLLRLKAEALSMDEQKITEDIKATVIKEKPKFWDKVYGEGIIGVVQNEKGRIFKISPSLGYNLSSVFSIGLGPTIILDHEGQDWNGELGLRTFLKGEIWKQRIYLQLEDNVDPVKVNVDDREVGRMNHAILFGGGCILPISKSIALNPSILYRVSESNPAHNGSSPWVFRLGFSAIGNKKK